MRLFDFERRIRAVIDDLPEDADPEVIVELSDKMLVVIEDVRLDCGDIVLLPRRAL